MKIFQFLDFALNRWEASLVQKSKFLDFWFFDLIRVLFDDHFKEHLFFVRAPNLFPSLTQKTGFNRSRNSVLHDQFGEQSEQVFDLYQAWIQEYVHQRLLIIFLNKIMIKVLDEFVLLFEKFGFEFFDSLKIGQVF